MYGQPELVQVVVKRKAVLLHRDMAREVLVGSNNLKRHLALEPQRLH